jgi:hypothetical protein
MAVSFIGEGNQRTRSTICTTYRYFFHQYTPYTIKIIHTDKPITDTIPVKKVRGN